MVWLGIVCFGSERYGLAAVDGTVRSGEVRSGAIWCGLVGWGVVRQQWNGEARSDMVWSGLDGLGQVRIGSHGLEAVRTGVAVMVRSVR